MPIQELLHWLAGIIVGAIATLLIQELLPERAKNKIRITARKFKLVFIDRKVPARLIWKYSVGARIQDVEVFAENLRRALLAVGFNAVGSRVINVEVQDGSRYEVILGYEDEESELLSIHIEAEEEFSVKRLEEDLLIATGNEYIKKLLNVVKQAIRGLEHPADIVEPELYMELQLKGLSSLSMLVEGLGIRLALADSRYKLVVSESGVSLLVIGFTRELLGLLRNLVLLYA